MHVVLAAASDVEGNITMYIPKGRSDNAAFSESAAMKNVRLQGVANESYNTLISSRTIDKLLEERKVESVALLKTDTQGHEFFVLKGAKDSLRSRLIKAVYAENDAGLTADQGVKCEDILVFMSSLGWSLYHISDYVVVNETFRPKPGAQRLSSLNGAGYDVLWLPN